MFRTIARGVCALSLVFVATILAACGANETMLAVHASATTRTTPDLAVVTLGVLARGANAGAAQQAQSTRMQAVVQAAQSAGAEDADIQTVGYSLEPQYAYARGQAPRITGYISRNTVSIRLRDLNAVSSLIDATVAEGANELHGIQFTFQDEESSREEARAQALATARQRATTYAEAAGLEVVGIQAIIEPGSVLPPMGGRRDGFGGAVLAEAAAPQAVINPGQLDNQASVTVVFVLR
ncbi:protein of unknown function DUF541 [alpha proteobacterium U9-1i]|nr:protein of unknown function DUF541 [alpha proteobacterium U9-1i]